MNSPKKACILIVDDNEELVESLYLQFSYGGFNVTKATDPVRALELSALIRPDVLIADIRMPKLDGIKLIQKFKEAHPSVKVILMTGYYPQYEKVINEALEQKLADRVIQKGFKALDIERTVYELLRGPSEQTELTVKGKLLFVDDEIEVLDFLKDYFVREQYDVSVAKSAEEGLKVYSEFDPEVVVTDIKMPGKDGIWLIKQLQDKKSEARIIVMTGQDNEVVLQELKEKTGICEYFSKPFGMDDLEELSRRILDRKPSSKEVKQDAENGSDEQIRK